MTGVQTCALPISQLRASLHACKDQETSIDLPAQMITGPDGAQYGFEIGALRKKCLLEGLDDLALTDRYGAKIDEFEKNYLAERPWMGD